MLHNDNHIHNNIYSTLLLLTDANAFPISPELPGTGARLAWQKEYEEFQLDFSYVTTLEENIFSTNREEGFTHNGFRASHGGCVAGDTKAVRTRVEASRMSPVHFTAMQGVVLGGEGQWLPFLGSKDNK